MRVVGENGLGVKSCAIFQLLNHIVMVIFVCDLCGGEIERYVGVVKGNWVNEDGKRYDGAGNAVGGKMGSHLLCAKCWDKCEASIGLIKESLNKSK